jgi:hypothetical protein
MRGEHHSKPPRGVGIDGVLINVRDEDYKELKVGCIFDVQRPQPQADGEEASLTPRGVSLCAQRDASLLPVAGQ